MLTESTEKEHGDLRTLLFATMCVVCLCVYSFVRLFVCLFACLFACLLVSSLVLLACVCVCVFVCVNSFV